MLNPYTKKYSHSFHPSRPIFENDKPPAANIENKGALARAFAMTAAATSGKAENVRLLSNQLEKELEDQERQEKERATLKNQLTALLLATGTTINAKVAHSRDNFHTEGKFNHFLNKEDHVKGEISQVVTKWFFDLSKEQQNLLATDPNQHESLTTEVGKFESGERFSYTYQIHFHKEHPVVTIDNMSKRRLFSL